MARLIPGAASRSVSPACFTPRAEPLHLLVRDEGDLPRIAAGLTRAFLPDASVAQLTTAGVGLVRSR